MKEYARLSHRHNPSIIILMTWYLYSLAAAVGFGSITLLLTYLSRSNISALAVNTWFWLLTGLIFLLVSLATSAKHLKIQSSAIKWFILLAFIAAATNYFSVKAFQEGPNTGIVRSVMMAQIVVATIGGIYLFHEGVSIKAGLGIILVVIGLLLLLNK